MEEKNLIKFINDLKTKDKLIDNTNSKDNVLYGDEKKDYMQYSWSLFGNRPTRVSIYTELDSDMLWNIIDVQFGIEDKDIFQDTEIYFESVGKVQDTTYYIRLTKFISIYFCESELVKESIEGELTDTYCYNMTVYFNNKYISSEDINTCLSILSSASVQVEDCEDDNNDIHNNSIFTLNVSDGNFSLDTLSLDTLDEKLLNLSFNDVILKDTKKLIGSINHENKSVNIICGERGVGKTDIIRHIIKSVNKKVIIIPLGLIDNTFSNIMFLDFLKANPDSLIVMEDCENFFDKKNQNNNIFSLNLLQILEGIYSNTINVNFMLTMNNKLNNIDSNLLDSIHIKNIIEIGKLTSKKAIELSKLIGNKSFKNTKKEYKLVDVYRDKSITKGGDNYF